MVLHFRQEPSWVVTDLTDFVKEADAKDCKFEDCEYIVTHDGKFHADEVFTIAWISKFKFTKSMPKIIRTRTCVPKNLDPAKTIVVDVGNGKYDHHNEDDKNYVPASAKIVGNDLQFEHGRHKRSALGLIYDASIADEILQKRYGVDIEKVGKAFELKFIYPLENTDNYGPDEYPNAVSEMIGSFNPISDEFDDEDKQDELFMKAVSIASDIIDRWFEWAKNYSKSLEVLDESELIGPYILVINSKITVSREAITDWNPNIKFIITKSHQGDTWALVSRESKIFKIPKIDSLGTSIQTHCKFVHGSGFMAVFDSLEHAVACACYVMANVNRRREFEVDMFKGLGPESIRSVMN